LDVPYSERIAAKAAGARWDTEERRWYALCNRWGACRRYLRKELDPRGEAADIIDQCAERSLQPFDKHTFRPCVDCGDWLPLGVLEEQDVGSGGGGYKMQFICPRCRRECLQCSDTITKHQWDTYGRKCLFCNSMNKRARVRAAAIYEKEEEELDREKYD
jgi:hypothetical protein